MTAYYNEIDPHVAQWLRNLIAAGHIAPGEVDERSIEDVRPSDLNGFVQCHFFAGIAVWSHALRKAGWSDSRPVWTGSCPCQPFSAAGKGAGFDDERHLWPAFHHLISQCKPAIVLGEQVASKDADTWIDLVHTDMEALGYAFGAIPFPSAGIGAPHIRDRLYWVAYANFSGRQPQPDAERARVQCEVATTRPAREQLSDDSAGISGGMADTKQHSGGCQAATANHIGTQADRPANQHVGSGVSPSGLDDTKGQRPGFLNPENVGTTDAQINLPTDTGDCQSDQSPRERLADSSTSPTNGFWRDADWLLCRDGKWRPVEPGTFPLANGAPARVGRLRAYGNGLCAIQAQGFIESVMDYMGPSV